MKGDRNRQRALEAKARFGEGAERLTAQRILDQAKNGKNALPAIPSRSSNSYTEQGRGLSMEAILQEYGDILEEQPSPFPIGFALLLVCSILFLIFFF